MTPPSRQQQQQQQQQDSTSLFLLWLRAAVNASVGLKYYATFVRAAYASLLTTYHCLSSCNEGPAGNLHFVDPVLKIK